MCKNNKYFVFYGLVRFSKVLYIWKNKKGITNGGVIMKPVKWKKQRDKNRNALKSLSRNIGITSSIIFFVSTVQNILNAFLVEHVGTISTIAGILALYSLDGTDSITVRDG